MFKQEFRRLQDHISSILAPSNRETDVVQEEHQILDTSTDVQRSQDDQSLSSLLSVSFFQEALERYSELLIETVRKKINDPKTQ
jgi:small-conductance mechanosensitive channel